MPSKSKVCFFFHDVKKNLARRNELKKNIESIFKSEKKKLGYINYIFCSDPYLLEINRKFLNHTYYTDIITFDFSEKSFIQGELFISVDRVKSNALEFGVSFNTELYRVMIHGILHLCGYNDKTRTEKNQIRKKEDFYLKKFGVI